MLYQYVFHAIYSLFAQCQVFYIILRKAKSVQLYGIISGFLNVPQPRDRVCINEIEICVGNYTCTVKKEHRQLRLWKNVIHCDMNSRIWCGFGHLQVKNSVIIVGFLNSNSVCVVSGIVQHKVCSMGFIKRGENDGVININTIVCNTLFCQRVFDK